MWRPILSSWQLRLLFAVLMLSACASDETFSREDAITALQTTGANEAEATCMADTLHALGAMDAADPRRDRTSTDRDALVGASTRCIGASMSTDVVVAGVQITSEPQSDPEPTATGVSGGLSYEELAQSDSDRRTAAIERLQLLGRSQANAVCIVDQLIDVYADDIFDSPNFGVGLDPFEAHAFAICASQDS